MIRTGALGTLAATLALGVAACGGTGGGGTAAGTPSPTPTQYALADRAEFLAAAPSCDALTSWYAQFPADTDVETAVANVTTCGTLPKPFIGNADRVGVNDELMTALLGKGDVPVDPAARQVALTVLAGQACDNFGSNSKSLYQVEQDALDAGGTKADYAPIVKLASTKVCPEYKEDFSVFSSADPVADAVALRRYLKSNWSVPPAEDSEYAAMAAVTCQSLRDGDSLTQASILFEYLPVNSTGHGTTIGRWAAEKFCPSFL